MILQNSKINFVIVWFFCLKNTFNTDATLSCSMELNSVASDKIDKSSCGLTVSINSSNEKVHSADETIELIELSNDQNKHKNIKITTESGPSPKRTRRRNIKRSSATSQDSLYELAGQLRQESKISIPEESDNLEMLPRSAGTSIMVLQRSPEIDQLMKHSESLSVADINSNIIGRFFMETRSDNLRTLAIYTPSLLLLVILLFMANVNVCSSSRRAVYITSSVFVVLSMMGFTFVLQHAVQGYMDNCKREIRNEIDHKKQMEESAKRFVPTEFLNLVSSGKAFTDVSVYYSGQNVSVEVDILFSDIRDFTTLSQSMDNIEAFDWLNKFTQRMTPLIRMNEGFVNKYLGDGIMAIFTTGSDALSCAIEMQNSIEFLNKSTAHAARYNEIKMGIGIHSGIVTAGMLGDQHRTDTVMVGTAVNVACLLEGLTKTYGAKILITDQVHAEVSETRPMLLKDDRKVALIQFPHVPIPIAIFDIFCTDDQRLRNYKREIQTTWQQGLNAYSVGNLSMAGSRFAECLVHGNSTREKPLDKAVAAKMVLLYQRMSNLNPNFGGIDNVWQLNAASPKPNLNN